MPRKTLLAGLAVLAALLVTAPEASAAKRTICPPGTVNPAYCVTRNISGLSLLSRELAAISARVSLVLNFHCSNRHGCMGLIELERNLAANLSSAHAATARVTYGTGRYSLKYKESANVKIHLTAAGQKAIAKAGKFSATVVAVTNGVRSVIGHLTVTGRQQHSTHATGRPGFTG